MATLKQYGLIPKALPKRHPTTHQVFGSVALEELKPLQLPDVMGPTDQGGTSFCYAYCTRQLCSDMDGVVYDENWNVAMTGRQNGAETLNGAPALTAMEAMVSYGPLKAADEPPDMTWELKGPAFIADWRNWPAPLFDKAAPRERVSVLSVEGPYDAFDNIRSAIQKHQRHVALATQWFQEFNEPDQGGVVTLPTLTSPFSWHMYEAMDFDTINGVDCIRVKPHEGARYGKGGYAYFSRPIINLIAENPLANMLMYGDVPTSLLSRLLLQHQSLEQIFEEIAARIEANL